MLVLPTVTVVFHLKDYQMLIDEHGKRAENNDRNDTIPKADYKLLKENLVTFRSRKASSGTLMLKVKPSIQVGFNPLLSIAVVSLWFSGSLESSAWPWI